MRETTDMLATLPIGIDFTQWEIWVTPLIGLVSASLALLMGHVFFRNRHKHSLSPPDQEGPPSNTLAYGGFVERRETVRRKGKQVKVLITDAEALEEPVEGWIMDRSMGGLCLSVTRLVGTGTILSVRTANAPQTTPWVQVEVKSCRDQGGRWELGCQYLRTPPWGILLQFG
jgi:hypothetical protein